VVLQLAGGTVRIPRQPTTIPTGVYTHWPVNLDLGGVPLEYATAELVCRLAEPATFVFSAWPGLKPEFAFPASASIEAPGARIVREGGHAYVDGLTPGPGVAITVAPPGGPPVQLVVLTREQALNLSKATLAGRERLVLSPAEVYFDSDGIHLGSRDAKNLQAGVYPAFGRIPASFRDAGTDGVFQTYASTAEFDETPVVVVVQPWQAAAPSVPVRVSPKPRAVAIEPDDADFERAAVWRLNVPADALAGAPRTFLQIAYEGDVARVYAGGRFDNDNFYKGHTMGTRAVALLAAGARPRVGVENSPAAFRRSDLPAAGCQARIPGRRRRCRPPQSRKGRARIPGRPARRPLTT
jgi:beta-galactosidase